MNRFFIICIFLAGFTPAILYAQSSLPKSLNDSLWSVWNNPSLPDSSRLMAMNKIYFEGYLFDNPDSAFYYAQLALDFAKSKNNLFHQAAALNTQGSSFYLKGNYFKAIEFYRLAYDIRKQAGNKPGIAVSLSNLANVYVDLGDYESALSLLNESLAIRKELMDKAGVASSLNNIANVYKYQGDYYAAFSLYSQAMELFQKESKPENLAVCMDNIGSIYRIQKNFDQAIIYQNRALEIRKKEGKKRGMALSFNNIGNTYYDQERFLEAERNYETSIALSNELEDKQTLASGYFNLANLYWKDKKYDKSYELMNKSLSVRKEIDEKQGIAQSLIGLGQNNLDQQKFAEALFFFKMSKNEAASINLFTENKDASIGAFKCSFYLDSFNRAKEYLDDFIFLRNRDLKVNYFTLSENEKMKYFESMEADFNHLFEFALLQKINYPDLQDSCYNLALKSKGITLRSVNALKRSIQGSNDTLLIKGYQNWIEKKIQIVQQYQSGENPIDHESEANQLERTLAQKSGFFESVMKSMNVKWQDIEKVLAKDEAAIEFVNFKSEFEADNPLVFVAIIIKKGIRHPIMVRLCSSIELKKLNTNQPFFNTEDCKQRYGTLLTPSEDLYLLVWRNLEEQLVGIKRVYFSPSGWLNKINFSAIRDNNGLYLGEKYQLHQLSSTAQIPDKLDSGLSQRKGALIMGGINYSKHDSINFPWAFLEGTRKESSSISSKLTSKGYDVKYYDGSKATEERFKQEAPDNEIIHIATHGFFFPDPNQPREELGWEKIGNQFDSLRGTNFYADWSFIKNPNPMMRSGIVFASANDVWNQEKPSNLEDGILAAAEISNLNLSRANLVVFSACETGLGDIKGSEGVLGLQRALKLAGAKNLLMSLWKVPDVETEIFMTDFYRRLIEGKSVYESFTETQKMMQKQYDPFFWAGFVLME